jgi:predicted amidophosphoribosyltransferase
MRKSNLICRYCAAPVEADAGVCDCCGVAYPTSELRAVLLSPIAFAVYVVVVLTFITFWCWQDF